MCLGRRCCVDSLQADAAGGVELSSTNPTTSPTRGFNCTGRTQPGSGSPAWVGLGRGAGLPVSCSLN